MRSSHPVISFIAQRVVFFEAIAAGREATVWAWSPEGDLANE